jgi:hypothetical protein
MRPALASLPLDQSPVYGALPHEISSSASPYPSFPALLHPTDASSSDRDLSSYGIISSPAEHIEQQNPDSSTTRRQTDRKIQSEPLPAHEHHDFSKPTPTSTRAGSAQIPPPPQIVPNCAPPGHFDMLPPAASTHASWQALHGYAQSHASEHGYALSINTTAKNRERIKLACVCYGKPKNTHKLTPETRVRKNRVSNKTGCKMWIEGKKQEDGLWSLRVGNPAHNHSGRAIEDWAVQRKRTWGAHGGRLGVGGVTAREEKERLGIVGDEQVANIEEGTQDEGVEASTQPNKANHSLENGGLVWQIVEQEMLHKSGPGQGRDRGVGRTVGILEERLPGIHIFKRDVYNIRARIKQARKDAGQQVGPGLDDSDNEDDRECDGKPKEQHPDAARPSAPNPNLTPASSNATQNLSRIDPTLIAQCNSALKNMPVKQESEVERLQREVRELQQELAQRTKELEQKNSENEGLRMQVELANMALYNEKGGPSQ